MKIEKIISGFYTLLDDPHFIECFLEEDLHDQLIEALETENEEFLRDLAGNMIWQGLSFSELLEQREEWAAEQ